MKLLTVSVLASFVLLGGCASTGWTPRTRNLPPWPPECREVNVKDPVVGEDKLAYAARERAGRVEANGTIEACAGWYEDVKSFYAGAQ